jgi:c-di-GMP-binding flagellar brake protein YcgR
MSDEAPANQSSRRFTRFQVPAMYTLLRVSEPGDQAFRWNGHIYDLSLGGMRFELDEGLTPGREVELRAMLPGASHLTFRAKGRVVRLHNSDEQDRGPVRMGLCFSEFKSRLDYERVANYLNARCENTAEANQPTAPATHPAAASDAPASQAA